MDKNEQLELAEADVREHNRTFLRMKRYEKALQDVIDKSINRFDAIEIARKALENETNE